MTKFTLNERIASFSRIWGKFRNSNVNGCHDLKNFRNFDSFQLMKTSFSTSMNQFPACMQKINWLNRQNRILIFTQWNVFLAVAFWFIHMLQNVWPVNTYRIERVAWNIVTRQKRFRFPWNTFEKCMRENLIKLFSSQKIIYRISWKIEPACVGVGKIKI